jgi:hypothetical protein
MCDYKDCAIPGDMAPRIVFELAAKKMRWKIPAILGLKVCAACRAKKLSATDVLGDGEQRLAGSLVKMRPGATHVRTTLEWISLTDADYKKLQGMRLS